MKRKALIAGVSAAAAASAILLYKKLSSQCLNEPEEESEYKEIGELSELDRTIYELTQKYDKEARKLLRDLIRIPAYSYAEDPLSGTSNHEYPRLKLLKKKIIELNAVESPDDVFFDEFGSLCWTVTDKAEKGKKRWIYMDGHSDTVYPLRDTWQKTLGRGIDCYNGVVDVDAVDYDKLLSEVKYVPSKDKWDSLIFGRGSADQLQGVVSQVFATKILLETKHLGSLKGSVVYSMATVAEEDNDGGSVMHMMKNIPDERVPDCVIFTEGTGDLELGPVGIYIGQRGRCQLEMEIIGKSCHGSMPHMGINPLEYASKILVEATQQDFKDHEFLGKGTRTASMCKLDTPSDCAVPAKIVLRFDRRMTIGEDSNLCVRELESLKSVHQARKDGCIVNIRIPRYTEKSWKGVPADNAQDYLGWITPKNNPVIKCAVEAYQRCVSQHVEEKTNPTPDDLRREPRVGRWIFSTDGVGYPIKREDMNFSVEGKNWVKSGEYWHPPMFGVGAGYEHHCHKIGEYLHADHLWAPIAVLARFPSLFTSSNQ